MGQAASKLGFSTGMDNQSQKSKASARLLVGNLREFEHCQRELLLSLKEGKKHTYDEFPGTLQSQIIRQIARELNLQCSSETDAEMAVWRPTKARERWKAAVRTITTREQANALFSRYASGLRRSCSFLTKQDLDNFATDAMNAYSSSGNDSKAMNTSGCYTRLIERVFENTMDMQADVGVGIHNIHGLTIDFFNVFLGRVAQEFGWSVSSMLELLRQQFAMRTDEPVSEAASQSDEELR